MVLGFRPNFFSLWDTRRDCFASFWSPFELLRRRGHGINGRGIKGHGINGRGIKGRGIRGRGIKGRGQWVLLRGSFLVLNLSGIIIIWPLTFTIPRQWSCLGFSSSDTCWCGLVAKRCGLVARVCGLVAKRCGLVARVCGLVAKRCGLVARVCGLVAKRCGLVARVCGLCCWCSSCSFRAS